MARLNKRETTFDLGQRIKSVSGPVFDDIYFLARNLELRLGEGVMREGLGITMPDMTPFAKVVLQQADRDEIFSPNAAYWPALEKIAARTKLDLDFVVDEPLDITKELLATSGNSLNWQIMESSFTRLQILRLRVGENTDTTIISTRNPMFSRSPDYSTNYLAATVAVLAADGQLTCRADKKFWEIMGDWNYLRYIDMLKLATVNNANPALHLAMIIACRSQIIMSECRLPNGGDIRLDTSKYCPTTHLGLVMDGYKRLSVAGDADPSRTLVSTVVPRTTITMHC